MSVVGTTVVRLLVVLLLLLLLLLVLGAGMDGTGEEDTVWNGRANG